MEEVHNSGTVRRLRIRIFGTLAIAFACFLCRALSLKCAVKPSTAQCALRQTFGCACIEYSIIEGVACEKTSKKCLECVFHGCLNFPF